MLQHVDRGGPRGVGLQGEVQPLVSAVPLGALRSVVSGVSSSDLVAQVWSGLFHEIFNEPTHGAVLDALVSWLAVRAA